MHESLIFILFLLLSYFAILKIPFFNKSGIGDKTLLVLFSIKILAGFAYALFYKLPKYYEGSDTWRFYRLSLKEKEWLMQNPLLFLKDLFVHGYGEQGGLFAGSNSYWNDLKSNIPVKMLALMNVITNNSYYTNLILFNFIFLIGLVALYKLFVQLYSENKWLILVGVFLLPSTLFWCSGIHKDGLILSATGISAWCFYRILKKQGYVISNVVIIIASLSLIFSLRNYIVFAILPAMFCWWIAEQKPSATYRIFLIVYLVGIIAFFVLSSLSPHLNFPQFIVTKQEEFLRLQGGSEIEVSNLKPTLYSFLKYLPTAVDMALFRPHLLEVKNFSYIPAIVEVCLFIILIILLLFCRQNNTKTTVIPSTCFFLFFGITVLLLAGYTITFSGAIVRYRSFALPFLITPMLCMIKSNSLLPAKYNRKK